MGYDGSLDYFDLFAPDAAWSNAAERVDVFTVAASWVVNYAKPDQLRQVVAGVAERGIALGLEIGALRDSTECGRGVEGFDGWVDAVQLIQAAGGRVDLVAFDEPFAFGHFWDGPNACLWTIERVADEAAEFVDQLRQLEPDLIVGDIEPMWEGIGAEDVAAWLDAYEAASGEPFAFLHLDADWARNDWAQVFLATERVARERGVAIGPIYNGGDAPTDAEWTQLALERAYIYEEIVGGRPDHVVLQSWMDRPDRVLPETDPTTFTGMINRYLAPRTSIELDELRAEAGALAFSAAVTTAGGAAIAGAPLVASLTPLDAQQTLALDGTVPVSAQTAVIGIRVNTEGAGPGRTDLQLYELDYRDGDASANLVANPRFSDGLDGWFVAGNGRATLRANDAGEGQMLQLRASRNQYLNIDSTPFAVSAGREYVLIATVRVPVESAGNGYVAVIFLSGTEVSRDILSLEPIAEAQAEMSTDSQGIARLDGPPDMAAGQYLVRVEYDGDLDHWPASLEQEITVR